MDNAEQLREEIRKKEELLLKLIKLWKSKASVEETTKVIKDAGFDVSYEEVEDLLALVQKEHAESISFEKLDPNELSKISGGQDQFYYRKGALCKYADYVDDSVDGDGHDNGCVVAYCCYVTFLQSEHPNQWTDCWNIWHCQSSNNCIEYSVGYNEWKCRQDINID